MNFPHVEPPPLRDRHRLLNVHRNVPGVLSRINRIVSDAQANIESQILATTPAIGYLVMDLNREVSNEVRLQMSALDDEHPHARPVLRRPGTILPREGLVPRRDSPSITFTGRGSPSLCCPPSRFTSAEHGG